MTMRVYWHVLSLLDQLDLGSDLPFDWDVAVSFCEFLKLYAHSWIMIVTGVVQKN